VAFAMGKPLVAALRGDGMALVEQSGSGITCVPGEAGLYEALVRLLNYSEDELLALGERGYTFYQDCLSLGRAGSHFEAILATMKRPA
jgi:glycosyltransferase involved in cell wall biosynthesis